MRPPIAKVPLPDGATRMATPTIPEGDAEPDRPRQAFAEDGPAEDGHPHRHQGDEQRRDAGRHRALAEGDHPHPAAEQEGADDERVAELYAADAEGRTPLAEEDPPEEQAAGDEEPPRRHEERRHRFDGHLDPDVGRAPDEVQRPEPDRDGEGRRPGASLDDDGGLGRSGRRRWLS